MSFFFSVKVSEFYFLLTIWGRYNTSELWCQRRLLRVPWTARRSKQSILNKINLEYSLERLMLKLKLQYFGPLMQRANSLKKTLMLGKVDAKEKRAAVAEMDR